MTVLHHSINNERVSDLTKILVVVHPFVEMNRVIVVMVAVLQSFDSNENSLQVVIVAVVVQTFGSTVNS